MSAVDKDKCLCQLLLLRSRMNFRFPGIASIIITRNISNVIVTVVTLVP